MCKTNPICRCARKWARTGGNLGHKCRRWGRTRQTKPIPLRAIQRTNAVPTKSYGELDTPGALAKQSQFRGGQARAGSGRPVAASVGQSCKRSQSGLQTSLDEGWQGSWYRRHRANRVKRSQFLRVRPMGSVWNPPPRVSHTQSAPTAGERVSKSNRPCYPYFTRCGRCPR